MEPGISICIHDLLRIVLLLLCGIRLFRVNLPFGGGILFIEEKTDQLERMLGLHGGIHSGGNAGIPCNVVDITGKELH